MDELARRMNHGLPFIKCLSLQRPGILACIVILLFGCGGAQDAQRESVLNRGLGAEPESLDTHKARTNQAGDVQRDLGEGLSGYTADGQLELAAAERVEVSEDGLQYTFWLRPEGKWSNGDRVTAQDFVFSFRRLVNPATAAFYAQQSLGDVVNATEIIAGKKPVDVLAVEAIDDLQLKITLNNAVPYFLALLSHPSTFPMHRPSVELHGDAHARPGNLVSNGAYKLQAWEVGSYIEIVRNEHYRNNDKTAIDRVRHHITPEDAAELNRYRAGELDITFSVPSEAFQQMRRERPNELRVSPFLAVYYYGFNLTKPPFRDNPKLRQALSMAIDRETLTEKVTVRGEAPAYGWVPPGTNNYEPRQFLYANLSRDERHRKARELYREAGFSEDKPFSVEIRYNTSQAHRRIALAVQSMWQEVLGVESTLINEEGQVLLENIRMQDVTQVFRSSWTGDYNDANTFLGIMESDNPSNLTGFRNDEYDGLMDKAAIQTDPGVRQVYLEEAEKLLLSEHPVIPLYFYVNKNMVSPRVHGWEDNVLNYHYSQHLSLSDTD
ncbi:MAG: peptide ABC transporter substrate-binding protein [Proteobacteria bacterium]|nr:peptide ABC transporter substrate-binding protein [Pseudomonadota bacterium]